MVVRPCPESDGSYVSLEGKSIMEPTQESDAKAIWSLNWRSTLFIPLMLPVAVVWLLVVMSIAVLSLWHCVFVGLAYGRLRPFLRRLGGTFLGSPAVRSRENWGSPFIVL
jgi:uncharacterized membrane protein